MKTGGSLANRCQAGVVGLDGLFVRWRIGNVTDFPADNQPSIDPVTGEVSWTPAAEGRYELLVEASDRDFAPGTATDGQRFTLTVSGNLPPRWISSPTLQVTAGQRYVYNAVAIDPNRGDALNNTPATDSSARGMTFDFGTRSPAGAAITAEGVLTWTVPAGQPVGTPVAFDIVATDVPPAATPRSATYIYTVQIQPENFAPTIEPIDPRQIVAGTELRIDVRARDQNASDVIAYSINDNAIDTGLSIDDFGRLRWSTDVDDVTANPIELVATASDGQRSATEAFTVTVRADTTGPDARIYTTDAAPEVGDEIRLSCSPPTTSRWPPGRCGWRP